MKRSAHSIILTTLFVLVCLPMVFWLGFQLLTLPLMFGGAKMDGPVYEAQPQAPPLLPLTLYLVCSIAAVLMLAQAAIRPLRKLYTPLLAALFPAHRLPLLNALAARLLFTCGLSLVPLCRALHMDAFTPVFFGILLAGPGLSFAVAIHTAVLLLWNGIVFGLWAFMSCKDLRYRVRRQDSLPPLPCSAPPAPKPRFRLTSRGKNRLFATLVVLALLSPLVVCDFREPKPLDDPAAQREFDTLYAALSEEHRLPLDKEMLELMEEFSLSADMDERSDVMEWSMLHLACSCNLPELTRYLLAHGADPNAVSAFNSRMGILPESPLTLNVEQVLYADGDKGEAAWNIFCQLLEHGAQPDGSEGGSDTPLHRCALIGGLNGEKSPRAEQAFRKLLDHGADFRKTPAYPLLYHTAANGWVEATRLLLEKGAPMERHGLLAIHGAASHALNEGTMECAKLLIEAGADVNARDEDSGQNALMMLLSHNDLATADTAAIARCGEMVQLFLQHGASLGEPWHENEQLMRYYREHPWLAEENLAILEREEARRSKSIGQVLREKSPALAAWLEEHGVAVPQP